METHDHSPAISDDWVHVWKDCGKESRRFSLEGRVYTEKTGFVGGETGIEDRFGKMKLTGEDSKRIFMDRMVKPQEFAKGMVFYIPGERNPIAFYYAGVNKEGSPKLYARKGVLKGVKVPESKGEEKPRGEDSKLGKGYKEVAVVPIGGKMVDEIIKTDEFVEIAFSDEKPPRTEMKLAHGYVGQVGYFVGDPWSIVANIDMFRPILDSLPTDPGVMNKFTSTFGIVTGPICILSAIQGKRAARRIGDTEGILKHNIRLVRGGVETVSGATMVGVRSVGLAASKATATKTILVANRVLGYISTVTGSLLYFFLMIPFLIDAIREGKFLHEWGKKKKEGLVQGFKHLVELIGLNTSDLKEVEKVVHFGSPEELYDLVKDGETLPEDLERALTRDEMEAVESRLRTTLLSMDPNDYPLITDWDQVRDCLLAKMLIEANRIVAKKKSEYLRRAGQGSYSDIRKKLKSGEIRFSTFGFNYMCLKDKVEFMEQMTDLATRETHSNLVLNSLLVFICTIGIASFIGATVFSGGAPLLASIIVMLVMNFLMTGVDLYAFIEEARALETSTKNDMFVVGLFILMSMFSLGVSFVFAQSAMARAVIVALGALMLSFEGAASYDLYQKLDKKVERKEDEEDDFEHNPSWEGRAVGTQRLGEDLRQTRAERALKMRRRNMVFRERLRNTGFTIN